MVSSCECSDRKIAERRESRLGNDLSTFINKSILFLITCIKLHSTKNDFKFNELRNQKSQIKSVLKIIFTKLFLQTILTVANSS